MPRTEDEERNEAICQNAHRRTRSPVRSPASSLSLILPRDSTCFLVPIVMLSTMSQAKRGEVEKVDADVKDTKRNTFD